MCTPSLAVNWLWIVALPGFGKSAGTLAGQLVWIGCAGVGHGGGGEKVTIGAVTEVELPLPDPLHAVATIASTAMTTPGAPIGRSIEPFCPKHPRDQFVQSGSMPGVRGDA